METSTILWSLLFGSIGFGYFIYGKRQNNLVVRYTGFTLILFPYFVPNSVILVLVGLGLMAVPYFIKL
jgi:hypothetical protein|tara:strand:- start:106 stop:309 length:204 start_codon:yes stop_codon:yes gene_type:complete